MHCWCSAHIVLAFTSPHPRLLAVNIWNSIPEGFLPACRIKHSLCRGEARNTRLNTIENQESMTDGVLLGVNSPAAWSPRWENSDMFYTVSQSCPIGLNSSLPFFGFHPFLYHVSTSLLVSPPKEFSYKFLPLLKH